MSELRNANKMILDEFMDDLQEDWRHLVEIYLKSLNDQTNSQCLNQNNDSILSLIAELNSMTQYLSHEEKLKGSAEVFTKAQELENYIDKNLKVLTFHFVN